MNPTPNTTNPLSSALPRFAATGIVFLGLGFIFLFSTVGMDTAAYFIQTSRHMHQHGYRPFSLVDTAVGVGIGYGTSFVAAFLASRWRWRYRPALSAIVAYAAFLAFYLPSLDWHRGISDDLFALIAPLVTAPLGALLGERLSRNA